MTPETILKQFGLNDKEIAVYLKLVELGPQPVRVIASKSGVNRGTTYDILRALMAQGLVSYFDKDSHQYFAAEPPEKLISSLENRQKELEESKDKVSQSLPKLKTVFERQGGKPVVKLFEGRKGIAAILEDVLLTMNEHDDKTYFVYSSATVRKNVYQSMTNFSDKRIKKGIAVKTIALGEGGQTVGLDERKWMHLDESNLSATYELIYGGKVAHISLDDAAEPIGIVVQNEAIYDTQKMIFEFNWGKL